MTARARLRGGAAPDVRRHHARARTLAVSTLRAAQARPRDGRRRMPSRFIAEMKLDEAAAKEDPREKLKALREAAQQRAQARAAEPATER